MIAILANILMKSLSVCASQWRLYSGYLHLQDDDTRRFARNHDRVVFNHSFGRYNRAYHNRGPGSRQQGS